MRRPADQLVMHWVSPLTSTAYTTLARDPAAEANKIALTGGALWLDCAQIIFRTNDGLSICQSSRRSA